MSKRNTKKWNSEDLLSGITSGKITLEEFAERVGLSTEEMAEQYDIKDIGDIRKLLDDRPRLEAEAREAMEQEMAGVNEIVDVAREFLDSDPDRLTALSMFFSKSKDQMADVEEFDIDQIQNTLIFMAFMLAEARSDLDKMAALTIDGNRRSGGVKK